MTGELKTWLQGTIRNLVGVQQCVANPTGGLTTRAQSADLRAALWTGVMVNVYIITEPLKTRQVRSIVQQDTNDGIGVLFIVAPHLLPAPDRPLNPEEWLLAIHALTNERIYTYNPDGPRLLQMHLERLDATERYSAHYGPPVRLERLHYGRSAVKPRFIKGFWLTAHFGPDPFWHTAPRRPGQAGKRHYTSQPPREKSRLERCYELLGIEPDAPQDAVKTAFRRQVFNVHPDVSALPKSMAEEKFRALAEAYEFIKVERGWS
jgi:DnaJ-domain-containing protein 1